MNAWLGLGLVGLLLAWKFIPDGFLNTFWACLLFIVFGPLGLIVAIMLREMER